jgi:hypothetical protein
LLFCEKVTSRASRVLKSIVRGPVQGASSIIIQVQTHV